MSRWITERKNKDVIENALKDESYVYDMITDIILLTDELGVNNTYHFISEKEDGNIVITYFHKTKRETTLTLSFGKNVYYFNADGHHLETEILNDDFGTDIKHLEIEGE